MDTENLDTLTLIVYKLLDKVQLLQDERDSLLLVNERILSANNNMGDVVLDSGDTAWLMTASFLVFFITIPGLTLYYAGMATRKRSLMTIAMKSFTVCCLVTLVWMIFGYSLTYSPGTPVIGGYDRFFLINLALKSGHPLAPTIPEALFCTYELGFAVITAALAIGSSGDVFKFNSMLIFVVFWHLLVYCPVARSNWSHEGFLHQAGVLDWAGGNPVHITSGFSSLVISLVIGKRRGFGEQKFVPNNVLHTITGACILWIGWYGFNGGGSYKADVAAVNAVLSTQIATGCAAFSWILMEYCVKRQPTVLGMINGSLAGLISITPAAGYVDATGAFFIGLFSGPVCYYGISVKRWFGFDDGLDAFGLHGIAGVYGGLMTGLFATYNEKGAFYGNGMQFPIQMYGIVVCSGWSIFMTYVILRCIEMSIGLRISVKTELEGLDGSCHGEGLYAGKSNGSTPSDKIADLLRAYAEQKREAMDASMTSRCLGVVGGEVFDEDSLESISNLFREDERFLSLFDSGDVMDSPRDEIMNRFSVHSRKKFLNSMSNDHKSMERTDYHDTYLRNTDLRNTDLQNVDIHGDVNIRNIDRPGMYLFMYLCGYVHGWIYKYV